MRFKFRSRELWQFQVDGYNAQHDFNLGVEFACKNSGKCKKPNDNRSPSEKETGVQRYIRSNVSILTIVVPSLFRSCHTITIKSMCVCDLSTVWHPNYSTESKWRRRIWQMPERLKRFIAVQLITWMKLTRLIRVMICNTWGKMKIKLLSVHFFFKQFRI